MADQDWVRAWRRCQPHDVCPNARRDRDAARGAYASRFRTSCIRAFTTRPTMSRSYDRGMRVMNHSVDLEH